jgi:hypothetical protein
VRYDNVRSAMAEEGLLRLVFREPALLDQAKLLKEQFSSELLGRFFEAARTRREAGQAVSPAALEGEFHPGGDGPPDVGSDKGRRGRLRGRAGRLPAHHPGGISTAPIAPARTPCARWRSG